MENWRIALGNDIRRALDSKVEDKRTALGNDIHGAPKKSGEWRIGEQHYAITSQGSRLEGGGCMNSARQ